MSWKTIPQPLQSHPKRKIHIQPTDFATRIRLVLHNDVVRTVTKGIGETAWQMRNPHLKIVSADGLVGEETARGLLMEPMANPKPERIFATWERLRAKTEVQRADEVAAEHVVGLARPRE